MWQTKLEKYLAKKLMQRVSARFRLRYDMFDTNLDQTYQLRHLRHSYQVRGRFCHKYTPEIYWIINSTYRLNLPRPWSNLTVKDLLG